MSAIDGISDEGDLKLLKQGAEAKVYTCTYLGLPVVIKERFQKTYRHPDLDASITKDRIKNEARAILRCKHVGIRTPTIYLVDLNRRRIYMEYYTQNVTLKEYFTTIVKKYENDSSVNINDLVKLVATKIGTTMRKMHNYNVIHGDLTTSNILFVPSTPTDEMNWLDVDNLDLVFIDFGLSYVDASAEDKGVDLYVLERALISTHNDLPNLFDSIIFGYSQNPDKATNETLSKLEEVRARGRKRTMVG